MYELFIKKKKAAANKARAVKVDQKIIEERKLNRSYETIGNITILNIGKRKRDLKFFKSVRDA